MANIRYITYRLCFVAWITYGQPCDVSDLTSLHEFVKAAEKKYPIGNVVHVAGIGHNQSSSEDLIKINALGTVYVNNAFLPLITEGKLINFASLVGHFYTPVPEEVEVWNEPDAPDFEKKFLTGMKKNKNPQPSLGEPFHAYHASKRFVMHYTLANASRFAKRNVSIVSISPGTIETPMLALLGEEPMAKLGSGSVFDRLGTSEEVATLVFLSVEARKPTFRNMNGKLSLLRF